MVTAAPGAAAWLRLHYASFAGGRGEDGHRSSHAAHAVRAMNAAMIARGARLTQRLSTHRRAGSWARVSATTAATRHHSEPARPTKVEAMIQSRPGKNSPGGAVAVSTVATPISPTAMAKRIGPTIMPTPSLG